VFGSPEEYHAYLNRLGLKLDSLSDVDRSKCMARFYAEKVIRSVNPAAEALLCSSASELEGKVIEEIAPILEYQSLSGAALDQHTAIEIRCKGVATLLVRDGSRVKVEISTSPILDKNNGSVSGVAAILRRIESSV